MHKKRWESRKLAEEIRYICKWAVWAYWAVGAYWALGPMGTLKTVESQLNRSVPLRHAMPNMNPSRCPPYSPHSQYSPNSQSPPRSPCASTLRNTHNHDNMVPQQCVSMREVLSAHSVREVQPLVNFRTAYLEGSVYKRGRPRHMRTQGLPKGTKGVESCQIPPILYTTECSSSHLFSRILVLVLFPPQFVEN